MYGLPSYACVSIEQFSVERGIRELHVRHGTGNAVVYPDLPIWGKLEIYDSPSDAVSVLSDDEKEEQFVRLIMVADNTQLTNMLEQGKEVCLPDAALYMRVDKTCPLYWVTWEVDRETDAIEIIVPKLPQKASRETILKILTGSIHGTQHPVVGRVSQRRRDRGRDAAGNALIVSPGKTVVRHRQTHGEDEGGEPGDGVSSCDKD